MQQPSQMYGLGSLVKSAVKGVKDFVKSDVGKAALLTAGGFGLAGMGPLKGLSGITSALFANPATYQRKLMGLEKGFFPGLMDKFSNMGNFGKAATMFGVGALGGGALQALEAAGLDTSNPNEMPRDTEALKSYLKQGYLQLNPKKTLQDAEAFAEANTVEHRADGGRIGFAEGMPKEGIETLLPKPKPSEMMQGVDKTIQSIDNFAQLIAQSGSPSDMRGHMDLFSDFIQKNNVDAGPAFQYLKNRVKELKPGMERYIYISNEDMPVQKAYGGRIGYRDAGVASDFQKWLEGKQQFDQKRNAEELYKEYLEDKRRQKVAEQKTMAANGGRIGFFKGAQADARAGRGAMSSGTRADYTPGQGTRDDNPFTGGGGNKNNTGPTSTPPTPKTNIFDKIKNNPMYQIVSPFVNPFSIGMSQLPIKAQQAIGIGGLLNKLGNVIFSPAGAEEFDMEAFQKAGAKKGFFGMNDELEAMQKYYDFAQKQKTMGKDPAAIRDSANIGSALYGIDMDLVPETFLQTEEDFTTQKAPISFFNLGGRAGYAFGNPEQNAMEAAGIEGLPLNQNPAGVKELDLRDSGGFIPPVGVKEKADDIPAMLSNNEFVFTADAVRGMGNGDVNKGAQRMYDMMKKLENGGRV